MLFSHSLICSSVIYMLCTLISYTHSKSSITRVSHFVLRCLFLFTIKRKASCVQIFLTRQQAWYFCAGRPCCGAELCFEPMRNGLKRAIRIFHPPTIRFQNNFAFLVLEWATKHSALPWRQVSVLACISPLFGSDTSHTVLCTLAK